MFCVPGSLIDLGSADLHQAVFIVQFKQMYVNLHLP